jgi:DNA-binding winged helix-turn-helix (wHTH) protein
MTTAAGAESHAPSDHCRMPFPVTILSFESCRLSLQTRQLVVGDRPIDLQPLVFDVLAYLAQNPRRLVRKDELLQAVWRSPQVSESVVARAVMKSRRAIGDSAATPRWLHTLHGRGYRLDVEVAYIDEPPKPAPWVAEPSSRASALAVLPWWNRTGDDRYDWTGMGLSSLVHHLVDQAAGPKLAPMSATVALWRGLDPGTDVLQAACEALGVHEALACELKREGPGWALSSWRGRSMRSAVEEKLLGGDIVQLATRLAELLTGHALSPEAMPADPFWREQLAQAIGLSEGGSSRQALELLNLCMPHFRPSGPIMLLKARLLYRNSDAEATIAAARQAIDLATHDGALVVDVRARVTMAYALRDLGRFDEAIAQCEAALALTEQTPSALTMRPRVLDCLSLTAMEHWTKPLAR